MKDSIEEIVFELVQELSNYIGTTARDDYMKRIKKIIDAKSKKKK